MNKRIFVDSDVILDMLCKREPFYRYAAELFTLADTGKISLFTTPLVFANLFYILRKSTGIEQAKNYLRKLRILINIVPMAGKMVDLALNSKFADFEDALQYYTAKQNHFDILLTRNIKDYRGKDILVQTPEEFIQST
jgi:predicted nucleic acid-binding protein